jgi:uroporphyrinogen-III synthase
MATDNDARPPVLLTRKINKALRQYADRQGLALEGVAYTTTAWMTLRETPWVSDLNEEDWSAWIFTSPRGVEGLMKLLGREVFENAPKLIYTVGEKTRMALPEGVFEVRASQKGGNALADLIRDYKHKTSKMAFIGASDPNPDLLRSLRMAGMEVKHMPVYKTIKQTKASPRRSAYEAVLFASPKAVESYFEQRHPEARHWVAIGQTSALAIEKAGKTPEVPSGRPSLESMLEFTARVLR